MPRSIPMQGVERVEDVEFEVDPPRGIIKGEEEEEDLGNLKGRGKGTWEWQP